MKTYWKTALVALVAVVLGCASASAQFRFGVKAGLNLNSLHFSNWKDNFQPDNGCGFTGGVMTEFEVPVIGLCFDASLMYTHMSATPDVTINDAQGNPTEELKQNKNFLELPINLKYKFPVPVVRPYLFTGPSFAFKLGGDSDYFKTKTVQCAWNIGLGFEVLSHLQIAGSYGFGMNNIMKNLGGMNTTDDFKVKNNYWTITAAYLF